MSANTTTRRSIIVIFCFLPLLFSTVVAQRGESPIKVFGYFQTSLQQWGDFEDRPGSNSFSLQQLNLFFQKDLARNWTAFVNFEVLNNFSSSRQWGALNLEEAWVKYRLNEKFNLKLGLQIPTFNNLNTIKNRTPLLPYIIRPIVYETSFNEFILIEEFVPNRAFAQAYGFFPAGDVKIDYAAYLGNSPNINDDRQQGQTGVDTSASFLVGGRLGLRWKNLKAGISATHEKRNDFRGLSQLINRSTAELVNVPTVRFAGDLSYTFAGFSLEGEFITVRVNDGIPELNLDLDFYYGTFGYHINEQLFAYFSYWATISDFLLDAPQHYLMEKEEILVSNFGLSYDLINRIRLKAQYARVTLTDREQFFPATTLTEKEGKFNVYSLAISVFF